MDVRDLRGRTALVTGAGSGIGRETAVALARRGADLILCDVAVCPGIINTGITQSARLVGAMSAAAVRQQLISNYQRRNYGPARVADGILKAIQRNRGVAPISPEAWLLYLMKRWVPGILEWTNRRVTDRMRRDLSAPQS